MVAKKSSTNRKEKRKTRWLTGKERKELRIEADKLAKQRNADLRKAGKPTPFEEAKAKAKARRQHLEMQPRTEAGNIITTNGAVKPCCLAKSYAHCAHNPKIDSHFRGQFLVNSK